MASHKTGHLHSRPRSESLPKPSHSSKTRGLRRTGLDTDRDGFFYVPESFNPRQPAPLIVMLHGAGGNAHHSIDPLRDLCDRTGCLILAPESQDVSWDVIRSNFGQDVAFIDEALEDVFSLYDVDASKLAIAGFSDGASYALSLGLTNGDLFSHVMAFSPGFMSPAHLVGSPSIYVSHGVHDNILPIDACSHKLVPKLEAAGLDVTYDEFDGGHTIPTDIGRSAFVWYLGSEAISETKGAKVHSREAGLEYT